MRATCVKIYTDNLRHNLKLIRQKIEKNAKMCVAVKADAYGHGAVECSKIAVECGADFLAVACVSEGIQLRMAGIKVPVLVLSLCIPDEMKELISYSLTPLVFDSEYIHLLDRKCAELNVKDFPVHLAVDTGMGRIGCIPEEAGKIAKIIDECSCLKLEGTCTHFAVADSLKAEDIEYTEKQFSLFLESIENIKNEGINPGIRHCANSALTLTKKDMHLDMCRPGIITYGYFPGDLSESFFTEKGETVDLKPVMAFISQVVAIRDFDKGKSVSYGRLWSSSKKTRVAVIPAGYADGFLRRFNQNGREFQVSIGGRAYDLCGRICMDQAMIEIGFDENIHRWDEVVIFGPKESGAVLTAQDIAEKTDTISYEITCGVSKMRVPKIFI